MLSASLNKTFLSLSLSLSLKAPAVRDGTHKTETAMDLICNWSRRDTDHNSTIYKKAQRQFSLSTLAMYFSVAYSTS